MGLGSISIKCFKRENSAPWGTRKAWGVWDTRPTSACQHRSSSQSGAAPSTTGIWPSHSHTSSTGRVPLRYSRVLLPSGRRCRLQSHRIRGFVGTPGGLGPYFCTFLGAKADSKPEPLPRLRNLKVMEKSDSIIRGFSESPEKEK